MMKNRIDFGGGESASIFYQIKTKNSLVSSLGLAVLAGITLISPASAVVSMSWTSIGNAGNAADPSTG